AGNEITSSWIKPETRNAASVAVPVLLLRWKVGLPRDLVVVSAVAGGRGVAGSRPLLPFPCLRARGRNTKSSASRLKAAFQRRPQNSLTDFERSGASMIDPASSPTARHPITKR